MLADDEYEFLNWSGNFSYPNMVRIGTIGDGSCYFHAIIKAFVKEYQEKKINGLVIDRRQFISKLRKELAEKLTEKVSKNSELRYYDILSRGQLTKMSSEEKNVNLTSNNLVSWLDSKKPIDNTFDEYISLVFNKDLYFLNIATKDVYIPGDEELLLKNRDSIVILINGAHYELVGLITDDNVIQTQFSPSHPFILKIRDRIKERINILKVSEL